MMKLVFLIFTVIWAVYNILSENTVITWDESKRSEKGDVPF